MSTKPIAVPIGCNHRLCPLCAAHRAELARTRVRGMFDRLTHPAIITLTILFDALLPKSYRKRKGRKVKRSILDDLFMVKRSGGKLRRPRARQEKPIDWKEVERRNEKKIEKLWAKKGWL